MNFLITGTDGLLGSHLVKYIVDNIGGVPLEHKITCIGRKLDVRTYKDFLTYDVIIHCAAKKDLKYCQENFANAWDVNVNGTKNIFNIKHKLFVYISSDMAADKKYGDIEYPSTCYGITKKAAEDYVKHSIHHNKLLIIRSGIIYPENIKWIDDAIKNNEALKLYYDRWRKHIGVNDYCKILLDNILGMLNYEQWSETIDICQYEPHMSQIEFVTKYLEEKGIKYDNIEPISRMESKHGSIGPEII
jgi:dTDP-4-dehydrorhamnose reductase